MEVVVSEVGNGAYDFSDIPLKAGDTVVDLGAHIGVVSMYLAKTNPGIRVLSFEPMPRVFALLSANLKRNRVTNVQAFNVGVSAHGKPIDMVAHLDSNTGGGTSCLSTLDLAGHVRATVPTTTIDDIFASHHIVHCPLLKIDIEGAEHEVLRAATVLDRVDNIRAEFHQNTYLVSHGHTMDGLREYCEGIVGVGHVRYTECLMADI
jgi:FkbM family methyltransferase